MLAHVNHMLAQGELVEEEDLEAGLRYRTAM